MEFCRCNKSFVCANSETETFVESCIIHLPTAPPCSTKVNVLETGDVPILFSCPQMNNLGVTISLDPERDKITCSAFGLYSSPAEYSTMTKSRERSGHPMRHVTFATSERKLAYPALARDLQENEDDGPLAHPDHTDDKR